MAIMRVFTTHIGNTQTEAILDTYAKMEDKERAAIEKLSPCPRLGQLIVTGMRCICGYKRKPKRVPVVKVLLHAGISKRRGQRRNNERRG